MSNTWLASEGSHPPATSSTPCVTRGYGILRPGQRVRLVGAGDTFAHRELGPEIYTVAWCGPMAEETHLRLAERPGFTFRRELFALAGRVQTAETRARIAAAARARGISAETRAKMAESRKGQRHTEQSKAKISAANKGRKHTISYRTLESLKAMTENRAERLRRWADANPEKVAENHAKMREGLRRRYAARKEEAAKAEADRAMYLRSLSTVSHKVRMRWAASQEARTA